MMNSSKLLKLLAGLIIVIFIISTYSNAQEGPKLLGAFFVKNKVGLKWTNVAEATNYVVYRQADGGEFINIATTDNTNYFDTDITGGANYIYKVAAIVNGSEVFGTTKSVNIPDTISAFSAPEDLAARPSSTGDGISLRWNRVRGAMAYNVLRSETSGSGYEVVGNSPTTVYTDTEGLTRGGTYYYVITAMNQEFEESEYSNEISFKFGYTEVELDSIAESEKTIFLDSIDLVLDFEITEADGIPLISPSNFTFSSNGDIYIIDNGNFRVICTDSRGKTKFTFGFEVYKDQLENPPDGGFYFPFAIALDADKNIYVSDVERNDFQVFDPKGKFIRRIIVNPGSDKNKFRSNGFLILDDGNILTSDVGNHRLLVIDTNGNILKQFTGEKIPLHYPNDVKRVSDNSYVVTNPIAGKCPIFTLDGEVIQVIGFGSGSTIGYFGRATGVAIDESGMIWVVDKMGSNIQAFLPNGEPKIVINSDKFIDENLNLHFPRGIHVRNGKIYIANSGKNKLSVFNYTINKVE